MLKIVLVAILPILVFFETGAEQVLPGLVSEPPAVTDGTLEKLIVASGKVSIDLDLKGYDTSRLNSAPSMYVLEAENDSFFTVISFNGEFRGHLPSGLPLAVKQGSPFASQLNSSLEQLVIDADPLGGQYELSIRDGLSGFHYFNIEGTEYSFDAFSRTLNINGGRILLAKQFAAELGREADAGNIVGQISITAVMRPIEITKIADGVVVSDELPAIKDPNVGTVPGPDVVVGDVSGLAQFGRSDGTKVGLALGTDSCNFGTINLNWFALPNNDHPVIPQNLYRMSGGATNDDKFEQIGQSSVKHAFTALTNNLCGLGCNGTGGSQLGSGCSDPYSASLNAGPNLGSRAWINPFTGFYPRGDSATPPNTHTGHNHNVNGQEGPAHRILTDIGDLVSAQNTGATYYAEGQYVTPHEYAWCQANPTQCNMNNNVSYRRYNVTTNNATCPIGTSACFSFSSAGSTQRSKTAVTAWTGASFVDFVPAPGVDGMGTVAYKVTNPSPGVWRYEYAVYNQNIDRGIQSFSIPLGPGITLSNIGFHAPPQHPGWANDGTVGNTGFSGTPWAQTQTGASMTWNSETFAQNQNANAIRWGTLYNFRFESNRPPTAGNATLGFFKTGSPMNVAVQVPTIAASNVRISGRVTTPSNRGINFAQVTISDGVTTRTTYTSSFGYYSFDNVLTGATYTFTVSKKLYTFAPQQIPINGAMSNLNFVSIP